MVCSWLFYSPTIQRFTNFGPFFQWYAIELALIIDVWWSVCDLEVEHRVGEERL